MRLSLRKRFTIAAALLASAVAAVAGLAGYRLAHSNAEHEAQDAIGGLVTAIEKTVAVGAYADDRILLDELAGGLIRHPMVARVRISSGAKLLVEQTRTGASSDPGALQIEQALHSPFDPDEKVGSLWVQADPAAIQAIARQQALWLALPIVLQVLLLAALLNGLADRMLTRPMTRLAAQVEGLEPGTSERLAVEPRHRGDEIGQLVASTNRRLQAGETAIDRERLLRAEVSQIEVRLRRLLESSSAAIFLLDREGRLVQGNPTLARFCAGSAASTGHEQSASEDFLARTFHDPQQVRHLIELSRTSGNAVAADLRLLDDADGERWVHGLLSMLEGSEAAGEALVEGVIYDVTQRRREEHLARHRAAHDSLTGLPNRAALEAELDRMLLPTSGQPQPMTLFYIDLDGFKQVNDSQGHGAGDTVLVECAARLQQLVRRSTDRTVRLGGDEFVVLLQASIDEPWVGALAWRIVRELGAPIRLADGSDVCIGASVGIAGFPQNASDRDGLLRQADAAMYQVKRAGKNAVASPQGLIPER